MASRLDFSQIRSLYVGTSSSTQVDTNNLIVVGNVGIGTTAPTRKLQITDAEVYVRFNPTAVAGSYLLGAADGKFYVIPESTYVPTMTFSSGNVGIGTTSPTYKLHVVGSAGTIARITDGTSHIDLYSGSGLSEISAATTMLLSTSGSERMRITSAGNVGIGTASPTAKLHIVQSNGGGVAAILLSEDESTIQGPSANTQMRMGGNLVLNASSITSFGTNGSERMRITSAGNVGIGTTAPFGKLNITRAGINEGAISFDDETSNAHLVLAGSDALVRMQLGTYNNGSYGAWIQASYDNGGTNYGIEPLILNPQGGNVGIGTTAPFSKLQVGGNTFNGENGMYANNRVGISNHGSLTGLMLASTYNDATFPEYGLVFVQGATTSDYNVWSLSPDGPAKGSGLNFIYGYNSSNIHVGAPVMRLVGGTANVLIGTTTDSGYKLAVNGSAGLALSSGGIVVSSYDGNTGNIKPSVANGSVLISDDSGTAGRGTEFLNNGGFIASTTTSLVSSFNSSIQDNLVYTRVTATQQTTTSGTSPAAIELVGLRGTSTHGRHAWIGAEGVDSTTFRTKLLFKIRGENNTGYQWSGAAEAPTILTVDGNGLVGVNTSSPANQLQIGSVGSTGYSGNHLAIGDGTSVFAVNMASNLTNLYTNKAFSFQASGAGATGNVLINTTTDAGYKLNVNGDVYTSSNYGLNAIGDYAARYRTYAPGDGNWGLLTYAADPEYHMVITGASSGDSGANRQFRIYDRPTGNTRFVVNFSNGFTGIGTTAPNRNLQVVGTTRHERVYAYANNVFQFANDIPSNSLWLHLGTQASFTTDKIYYRVGTNTSEEEGEIIVSNTCSLPLVEWHRNSYNVMVTAVKARMQGGCGSCEIWIQVRYGSNYGGANTTVQWQVYNGTDSGFATVNATGTPGTGTNERNLTNDDGYFYETSGNIRSPRYSNAGFLGINQSNARNHFTALNAGSASPLTGWIAAAFGDALADRIVIGQWTNGAQQAIFGAHNANLNDWADTNYVSINHNFYSNGAWSSPATMTLKSNGNLLIGTTTDTGAKLRVYGGYMSVDGSNSSVSIESNYGGSGGIEPGTLIAAGGTNANISIIPSGGGVAGTKVVGAAWNGSAWRSMWEFANVSSGEPVLSLVRTAGNVGIGTTSPSEKLHVDGNIVVTYNSSYQGINSIGNKAILARVSPTSGIINYAEYATAANLNGFVIGSDDARVKGNIATDSLEFITNGSTQVTVLSNGNVGIANTNPSEKLSVTGNIRMDNGAADGPQLVLGSSGFSDWNIDNFSGSLRAYYGSTEYTRLTSSGNFGIGVSPSYKLDVAGDTRITSGALGVGVAPNATDGRIDASNDIVAYSSSDRRLKENITPIANALDKVKSLTGVEFDWRPEHKKAHGYEGHDTGVIAQEVQEVMPTAVRTNDTGYLAVRYEKLIGLLIEANKELAARVEELEKKLN